MIPKTRKEAFRALGLPEYTSEQEVKKAFYRLALKWHPDKWSDKSQEKQKVATEKFKKVLVAYRILTSEVTEEFISQQPNDDWIGEIAEHFKSQAKELLKERYGLHLSEEEVTLFKVLDDKNLIEAKSLLEKVKNINLQARPFDLWDGESILHYIVRNSCNNFEPGWIELLEETLLKYSAASSSVSDHSRSVGMRSQLNVIDVNILGNDSTPLHVACKLGNLDVINILLKYGADPNTRATLKRTPLYHALKESKKDVTKVLLEHGAKIGSSCIEEMLILSSIAEYNRDIVETLLLYISSEQKSRVLQCIALSDDAETDRDVEIVKSLLEVGADPEFCDTKTMFTNTCASFWAMHKGKSQLIKLFSEYKEKSINDDSNKMENQVASPLDNENHHYPQEQQASGVFSRVTGLILFGTLGAILVAVGIIPEITAVGLVVTALLSGIVGAALGGTLAYLTDITVNKCCNSEMKSSY